ncbi:MAG: DNA recombination protein RmuC [Lentisphaerae bacterium]|jgi:DNA recombination protein RmuC|nr:DNA recombination protein RmuC [Lentisphaerota bacterium]
MRRWRCGRAGVPEGMDGSVSTELILLAVLVVGVFLLLVFVLLLLVRTAVTNSDRLVGTVNRLVEKSEDAFLAIQTGNERKLAEIQASNEQRLDAMRQLVDEKLQSTLEQRLGESFRLVGERLEAVQRGLGEMQALANGVGDLKRILVNVRERGTWGEYQLGAILEDILTPGQYEANVRITEGREQVEYAVKLPGRGRDAPVWLPIDAKFPKESYERLVEAATAADAASVQSASAELRTVVARMAQDIQRKYICPPASTDFAILFLPTEGLFAEVLRLPGLHDTLQRKHRVLVAGPTTLAAILNSLRVGFQTLAIEQRAGEVWQVLGAVKTEFGTFSNYLDLIKRQIQTVSNTLDLSSRRTRAMQRKLRSVEELPRAEAGALLGLPVDEPLGGGAEDDVEEDSEEVQ